ncbi:MAG: DNA polymerase III subunit beta [Planctomycetota bacterium]
MKILCDRAKLQEAFGIVSSVVSPKTPNPILRNVLLKAEGEGITLTGTDLELAATVVLDAVKVAKAGKVLLPARETAALLRELNDPTITLESKDLKTRIESGGGSFVLLGENPDEFAEMGEIENAKELTIEAGQLLAMTQETTFAAAREETRYAINGVLMDYGANCLRLVATDGRRLAMSYRNIEGGKKDLKAVVPTRAMTTVARAIKEGSKDPMRIAVGEKQIRFSSGGVTITCQLLEARYPDYESAIPKAADTTLEIDKALFESSLRKASILASDDLRMVRFEASDGDLRITAENSSRGRAEVRMAVVTKGAGGSINFNPDYLLEALRVSSVETVRLDMSDDSMPAKFTLGESFSYVVMPISGA